LKPENLLLDAEQNIKIIDFGFGNTFHRERLLDTYCGSPFYAAPEMIRGIKYIGPEVDVWSLGVILFALLSGRLPFDAQTVNELYDKIARGKYDVPRHFSVDATHLIARMLHTDPARRATLDEVKHHVWVTTGFSVPVRSHLKDRPFTVARPHPESLAELVSYGFREEEIVKILRLEVNPHPIVSLYHLIDETRKRKENVLTELGFGDDTRSERTNSLVSISTPPRKVSGQEEFMEIDMGSSANNKKKSGMRFPKFTRSRHSESDAADVPLTTNLSNVSANPSPVQQTQQNRPVRGLFNFQVHSDKTWFEISIEVERVLGVHNIGFEKKGRIYACTEGAHKFEIEIRDEKNQHEVFFRKLQGSYWNHKNVCNKLLKDMQL
jgi:serine/threonine protein kinase